PLFVADLHVLGVVAVDLDEAFGVVEKQHAVFALQGLAVGDEDVLVPVVAGVAQDQREGKVFVSGYGRCRFRDRSEFEADSLVAIGEEKRGAVRVVLGARPLAAVFDSEISVAGSAVEGYRTPDLVHDVGGRCVLPVSTQTARYLGDLLPGGGDACGRLDGLFGNLDPTLGAGEGDAFFGECGGGKDYIGQFGGFGQKQVLDDDEFAFSNSFGGCAYGSGVDRVVAVKPDSLDLALGTVFKDRRGSDAGAGR